MKSSSSLFTQKEEGILKQLIQKAVKNNAAASIVLNKHRIEKVLVEHDTLTQANSGVSIQVAMRIMKDNKESIFRSNSLNPYLVEQALYIAKALPEKESDALPKPEKCKKFKPDLKLISAPYDRVVDDAQLMLNEIKSKNVIVSAAEVIKAVESRIVATTSGTWCNDERAEYHAWASGVSQSKKSTYSDSESRTELFKPNKVAQKVTEKVNLFENTTSLKEIKNYSKLPAIFTPGTAAELLEHAFLSNLNAENVVKNKSLFKGKLGKKLVGKITIIDDGLKEKGMKTYSCDEEGTSQQRNVLISNGTIKRFITDSNSAAKLKMKRTGNAGLMGPDFTNLIILPFGKLPDNSIIIDTIIGAHTSNDLTTDFSVNVENGLAKMGNKLIPLKPFMISGKMIDFLRTASAVGKDTEEHSGIYLGSISSKACSYIP